jgi:WD40 repeat protein
MKIVVLLSVLAGLAFHSTTVNAQSLANINDMAWNHDGTRLAVAYDDGILGIFDIQGQLVKSFHLSDEAISDVEWSPTDSHKLAVSIHEDEPKLLYIDDQHFDIIHSLPVEYNFISRVTWNADGTRLATLGEKGEGATENALKIWDTENGKLLATYQDIYSFTDAVWNPAKPFEIAVTGVNDILGEGEIVIWDSSSNKVLWSRKGITEGVLLLAWNSSGSLLAAAPSLTDNRIKIRIYDLSNQRESVLTSEKMLTAYRMLWSPHSFLIIANTGQLEVWNSSSQKLVYSIPVKGDSIAWNSAENLLAYLDKTRTIQFQKLETVLTATASD